MEFISEGQINITTDTKFITCLIFFRGTATNIFDPPSQLNHHGTRLIIYKIEIWDLH